MTSPAAAPAIPDGLTAFVFKPDQFLKDDVPRDLEPEQIEELARQKITMTTPPIPLEQLFKVVDYYDVYEVAPHLLKLLNKNERSPEDIIRSAILARIIALVGLPDEFTAAKNYYDYLVDRADTLPALQQLIALYEVLGPPADPKALIAKLDAKVAALAKEMDKNDASRAAYNAMERLRNFTLARAMKANDIKKKILAIKDRPARIAEEVQTYLAMKYGFGEYLPAFAARRLKHETWAEQPEQQLKRTLNVPFREQVAQAFRDVLPAIKPGSPPEPEKQFATIAAYDAMIFFKMPLAKPEYAVVNEKGAMQKNILSIRKYH